MSFTLFNRPLASLLAAVGFLSLAPQAQSQLIFSEYVEGTGNNKCVELVNIGGTSIDLDDYQIRAYQNGAATPTFTITLPTVSLAPFDVFVVCNTSAGLDCGNTADFSTGSLQFNGDDALETFNTLTSAVEDIFGTRGQDPGSQWTGACGFGTQDVTLRRSTSAYIGRTANGSGFPTLCSDWFLYNTDDCSGLGVPNEDFAMPACLPIISEYVEGTSNNKFLEIYNPCCEALNLEDIKVHIWFNACTQQYILPLTGVLANDLLPAGQTVVLYNPNQTIATPGSNWLADSRLQFNGNDAIVLVYQPNADTLDLFGNLCENIVWIDTCGVGDTLSTLDRTLRRDPGTCTGVTSDPAVRFPTLCGEWNGFAVNTVADLGMHVTTCFDPEACESGKMGETSAETASATRIEAYPNPFSGTATIRFTLPAAGRAQLNVYRLDGALVATLFDGDVTAGQARDVTFDGSNLPAGTYLYRLQSGATVLTGKLALQK